MNSDNYEFAKSSYPQSVSEYTNYTDKQWNYLSDINSQVYSNNSGLTLVTWDLTSVYSAGGLCDISDLYLAIPVVTCAVVSSAAGVAAVAPTAGYGLCSLKSNYQNCLINYLFGKMDFNFPFVPNSIFYSKLSSLHIANLKGYNKYADWFRKQW